MNSELKKFINKCGCIDIKVVVLLFFLFVIIYTSYRNEINSMITGEDCDCDN